MKCEKEGYSVFFLDFPEDEVFTCGETLQDAYEMAQDRLFIEYENSKELPKPNLKNLNIDLEDDEFTTLIELDVEEYAEKTSKEVVNTMVTMPKWLKIKAVQKNINFSQLLQEGIKDKLDGDSILLLDY